MCRDIGAVFPKMPVIDAERGINKGANSAKLHMSSTTQLDKNVNDSIKK